MKASLSLLSLCSLMFMAEPALAQCSFFVNASDGDDNNPGTQTQPIRSVEMAFTSFPDESVVCVAGGEYFRGDDEDGINLAVASKRMTFILNEFGGSTEVRFSEGAFVIDIGSGTVNFEAGTASTMVFGSGVQNVDGIFPDRINYLHSLEFRSGTVSFSGLTVVIEPSVGDPAFQNPDNPQKPRHPEASIVLGPANIVGGLAFEPADRVFVFEGSGSGDFRFPLPTSLGASTFVFEQQYSLIFDDLLTFSPLVTTVSSTVSFTGSVAFDGGLQITGTQIPDILVEHAGAGEIRISQLEMVPQNAGSDNTSLVIRGSGLLELEKVVSLIGNDFVLWPVGLENTFGTLQLGVPGELLRLYGNLVNSGIVELNGPVVLATEGLFFDNGLDNSGTVNIGDFNFTFSSSTVLHSSKGNWQARSGRMLIESGVTMTGSGDFPAVDVIGSSNTLPSTTYNGDLRVMPQATLTLGGANTITIQGDLIVESATMAIPDGADLTVQGDLEISNGGEIRFTLGSLQVDGEVSLDAASSTILVLGQAAILGPLSANNGSAIELGAGSIVSFGGPVTLLNSSSLTVIASVGEFQESILVTNSILNLSQTPEVTFFRDFLASQGAGVFLGESMIEMKGDVIFDSATLSHGTATITLSGTALQHIQAPEGSSFPRLLFQANSVLIETDMTVDGALDIVSGVISVMPSKLLTVNSLTMTNGLLSVGDGSVLTVLGTVETSTNSSVQLGTDTRIILLGDAQILSNSFLAAAAILELAGDGASVVSVPALSALQELVVNGSSSVIMFSGAQVLTLGARLTIASGNHLILQSSRLELSGLTGIQELRNEGRLSGNGGVDWSGPIMPGTQPTLYGNGTLGNMTLQFSDPGTFLSVSANSTPVISGVLRLSRGSIELNGAILDFSSLNTTPSLEIDLSTSIESDRISDLTENFNINPSGTAYNLGYSGSLQQMYLVGREFTYGPLSNLTISTQDALNVPSVFGVLLSESVSLMGELSVLSGARLRLDGSLLMLPLSQASHTVNGDIVGSGAISILGASSLNSTSASGAISNLLIDAGNEQHVTLTDLLRIDSFTLRSGLVTLDFLDATEPLTITAEIIQSGGILNLNRDVLLGNETLAGSWMSSGGGVIISPQYDIVLSAGSELQLTANSSWTLGTSDESSAETAGFIIFSGQGRISSETPLPRLKLVPASADENDIILTGDVTVSDALFTRGVDLFLGPNTFTLSGTSWSHEVDQQPERAAGIIYGNFAGNGGQFVLSGTTMLSMGGDLRFNFASFSVLNSASDVVQVESSDESIHNIILVNRRFEIGSGRLNLGSVDLILEGNIDPLLILGGGSIGGEANPETPAWWPPNAEFDSNLFPFNDDRYGEVVMSGLTNSSIHASAASTITNLRVNRSVRLSDSTSTITVSNRFVFGENGAAVSAVTKNRLRFSSSISLLRRGMGSLSVFPVFEGAVDVFYDLDDGSLSGHNSTFAGGTVLSGQELPSTPFVVTRLGILGGQFQGTPNTVKLTRPVQVRDLIVFSGVLDGDNQPLEMVDSDRFSLIGVDSESPPSFVSSVGYTTPAPIDLQIISLHSDIITSEALFPADALISDLFVSMGRVQDGGGKDFRLHAPRSIGSLHMDHGHSNSRLLLSGNTLSIEGNALLSIGTLTSDAAATLHVTGSLRINSAASISGGVTTIVTGEIDISGSYLAQSLKIAGDLTVGGLLSPLVSLTALGSLQTIDMRSGNLELNSLTLDMQPPGSGEMPRLVLANDQGGANLQLSSGISFIRGILDTGNSSVVLPLNLNAISHSVVDDALSHVIGRVSYSLPENFTGDLLFPLGSADRYNPIRLRFDDPLLSASRIQIGFEAEPPFGKAGLPLVREDGLLIQDTTPFSWVMTSSVNFATSQSFGYSVVDADTSYASIEEMLFLIRDGSTDFSPWIHSDGLQSSGFVAGKPFLRQDNIVGGLNPRGTRITMGIPNALSERSSIKIVNLLESPDRGPLDLYLNERLILSSIQPGQNTLSLPIDIDDLQSQINFLTLTEAGENPATDALALNLVSLSPGTLEVISIYPGPGETTRLTTSPPLPDTFNNSGHTRVLTFNATRPSRDIRLSTWPIPSPVAINLSSGNFSVPTFVVAETTVFEIEPVDMDSAPEHYLFDLSEAEGETVVMLATGDTILNLALVLEDGSSVAGALVTKASEKSELPSHFSLGPNYPNPFRSTTRIQLNMARAGHVKILLYDLLGRLVQNVDAGMLAAGVGNVVQIDGSLLASGPYLYVVQINTGESTLRLKGKMTVLR